MVSLSSTGYSALHSYDILGVVFAFVDRNQLPSVARVCKTWQDPAIDKLWRVLDSPFPLFDLLGSLELVPGGWVRKFAGTLKRVD